MNISPSEEHAHYDSTAGAPVDSPTPVQSTVSSSSYHRRAARHLSLPPPPRSSSSAPPQYETIYDPYTGQYRGQLVPPHSSYRLHQPHMSRSQRQPDSPSAMSTSTTNSSASSIKTSSSSSSSSSDKEDDFPLGPPPDVNLLLSPEEKKREKDMWATLARIRDIQSEVSQKQLSLEAFAVPSAYPKDNKATTLASSEDMQGGGAATVSPRGSISRKSGRETVAGGISDDPASVKTDKRSSKTPATGSPTTATAAGAAAAAGGAAQPPPRDAFAQRREAIDEIVKKLDDLSSAVKQLGAHNRPPTSPPTQPAHPAHQPPTLQIPTTRPAEGFGWRSPSTSSYNSFKEQFNARNKQRQAGSPSARVASPPPLQRATTAPVVTVQPPSATSPTTRPMAYPGPTLQSTNNAATPRVLVAAPALGGYSSASSREDYYLSAAARNRQPLLYDSPSSTQGEL
ncbi:hypothetical protein FRC01_008241 [Tulasnella sp. 417]|nr:hypothetical protein FRC01_008241 [Tulasnella sp. 417]